MEFRYKDVMVDPALPPAGLAARRLGAGDIPACLALSVEAGWNQTARDWATLIAVGHAVGLCSAEAVVASAVALPYGAVAAGQQPIGFVSMVLVTAAWRRRGLASWLVGRCLAVLDGAGCTPVLDATPDGQPVYRRLGFADGIALDRWRAPGVARAGLAAPAPPDIRLQPADLAAVAQADARAFGAARGPVLQDLLARRPDLAWAAWQGRQLAGFALGRDGRVATQVGPVVAARADVAAALLGRALAAVRGPAIVDLRRADGEAAGMLAAAGFAPVRSFVRMHRGDAPVQPALVAAAGPELG